MLNKMGKFDEVAKVANLEEHSLAKKLRLVRLEPVLLTPVS